MINLGITLKTRDHIWSMTMNCSTLTLFGLDSASSDFFFLYTEILLPGTVLFQEKHIQTLIGWLKLETLVWRGMSIRMITTERGERACFLFAGCHQKV